jgi:hypothetical protein
MVATGASVASHPWSVSIPKSHPGGRASSLAKKSRKTRTKYPFLRGTFPHD